MAYILWHIFITICITHFRAFIVGRADKQLTNNKVFQMLVGEWILDYLCPSSIEKLNSGLTGYS